MTEINERDLEAAVGGANGTAEIGTVEHDYEDICDKYELKVNYVGYTHDCCEACVYAQWLRPRVVSCKLNVTNTKTEREKPGFRMPK